jgi:hypothetical protein
VVSTDGVLLRGAGLADTILDAEQTGRVLTWDAPTGRVHGFTLTGGVALAGGGVAVLSGQPEIDHNLILANGARDSGSGVDVVGTAAPWFHHNVVWLSYDLNMDHPGDPHGMQFRDSTAGLVEHNLIGRTDSNGLFYLETSEPVIRHNIFHRNGIEGLRGRGICAFGTDQAVIAHNVFFENAIAALIVEGHGNVSAQEANGLQPGFYGNVDGDPLLRDPEALDFRLSLGSAAIDAGDPQLPGDPDGTVADVGPYWFDQTAVTAPPGAGRLALSPAAPNPFNPRTTLRLRLGSAGPVTVEILDARGRRIRTLVDGTLPAGEHLLTWDGRDGAGRGVVSGVYRARARTPDEVRVRGLVLLR